MTGRARARDLDLAPGMLPTGQVNAITDVAGVRLGHATLIEGDAIRTGVTAIVHDALLTGTADGKGSLPAGLAVCNGYGKMVGSTQVALLSYLHDLAGNDYPGTLNPVVAETNDGYLSDGWARPITDHDVWAALDAAAGGPVREGCVGAGTGTGALGFKAGVGTSSRLTSLPGGTVTVGALVQSNFGGTLAVRGVPVPPPPVPAAEAPPDRPRGPEPTGGSCVIVLATDGRLDARRLERVARRAFAAMARAGADFSGRSGYYALAFSTATEQGPGSQSEYVPDDDLDLIFAAAIEATEEAILNSLFMAESTTGLGGHVRHAVPLDYVRALVSGR